MNQLVSDLFDDTEKKVLTWRKYGDAHLVSNRGTSVFELIGWYPGRFLDAHLVELDATGALVRHIKSGDAGCRLIRDLLSSATRHAVSTPSAQLRNDRIAGVGANLHRVSGTHDCAPPADILKKTARAGVVSDTLAIVDNLLSYRQTKGPEDNLTALLLTLLKSTRFFLAHTFAKIVGYSGSLPRDIVYSSGETISDPPLTSAPIKPDLWISDRNEVWSDTITQVPGDTKFNIIVESKFGANFTPNQIQSLPMLKRALTANGGQCHLVHIGIKPIDKGNDPFRATGGNPFDTDITWYDFVEQAKADLVLYRDHDALLSLGLIQALDAALGQAMRGTPGKDHVADFLRDVLAQKLGVPIRRASNRPNVLRVDGRITITIEDDLSLTIDEIPPRPGQHQESLGAIDFTTFAVGSAAFEKFSDSIRQFLSQTPIKCP